MRTAAILCAALAGLLPALAWTQDAGAPTQPGSSAESGRERLPYAARIARTIKSNLLLKEDIPGNPVAEVEIVAAPDGRITSRRLLKSSGSAAWDAAVLQAVDRAARLPLDVDGRIPPRIILDYGRR